MEWKSAQKQASSPLLQGISFPPALNAGPMEKGKWLLLNNHTSLGRLSTAALVGSQSRRRTTPIRNPRVAGVPDRLDVPKTKVLKQEARRRTLPQKT